MLTPNEKSLLLKDLCCRLPYNPLISINGEKYRMEEISNALIGIDTYKITVDGCDIEDWDIKPYLFPLSSMTDEQWREIEFLAFSKRYSEIVDIYNRKHIDYRGLIPMGLANDASGLNIYKKMEE